MTPCRVLTIFSNFNSVLGPVVYSTLSIILSGFNSLPSLAFAISRIPNYSIEIVSDHCLRNGHVCHPLHFQSSLKSHYHLKSVIPLVGVAQLLWRRKRAIFLIAVSLTVIRPHDLPFKSISSTTMNSLIE